MWLTIKDGMVMATAGIDESNGDGKLILLPKNSFKAAEKLRKQLLNFYKIRNLGVIISDSRTTPLRRGITGAAIGYAGISGLKKYRGAKDIFGRSFKFSSVNIPDSLAAAAVLIMGEGAEKIPLALITDVNIKFQNIIDKKELRISIDEDIYAPVFGKIRIKNKPFS